MFTQIPDYLAEGAMRLLLAALAFALIWVLRHLLTRFARMLLQRIARRNGVPIDVTVRDIVTGPVRLLTLALAIDISSRILLLQPAADIFIFRLSRTFVLIAIAMIIYRLIGMVTATRSRAFTYTGLSLDEQLLPFIRTFIQLLLIAIALIIVIQIWGYDVTGLVAGLGIGGLAVSLAAQDTVANLFGFSMIVSDRPFVVGEFIKTPDVEGVVERVGFRSSSVRQLNQALVTIPNSTLANSPILNWSRLGRRWIDQTLRISYGATPDQLLEFMSLVREMLATREDIDPETIVVHFINFGENALEILVRAYVNRPNWLEFTREKETINLEIMRIVHDLGLSFALPSRALYVEKMPGLTEGSGSESRIFDVEVPKSDTGDTPPY